MKLYTLYTFGYIYMVESKIRETEISRRKILKITYIHICVYLLYIFFSNLMFYTMNMLEKIFFKLARKTK